LHCRSFVSRIFLYMGKRNSKKRKKKLARPPRRKAASAEPKWEIPELPPEFYARSEDDSEVKFARSAAQAAESASVAAFSSDGDGVDEDSARIKAWFNREPDALDAPQVSWRTPSSERPFGAVDLSVFMSLRYQKFHAEVVAIRASLPETLQQFAVYDVADLKRRRWLTRYTIKKEKAELYDWQQVILENAGFNWVRGRKPVEKREKKPSGPSKYELAWMQSYEALREVCAASNPTLAMLALLQADECHYTWLRRQVVAMKVGNLNPERLQLLQSLPFDFDVVCSDRGFTHWRARFKAYVTGEIKDPTRWAARQCYARKHETLLEWRIQVLDAINFDWSIDLSVLAPSQHASSKESALERMEARWRAKLDQFLTLEAKYGKPLSMRHAEARPLRSWLSRMREHYKKGALRPELIAEFEARGFEFSGKDLRKQLINQSWDQQFKKLEKFKERFGHVRVPSSYRDDPELGSWLGHQRERLAKGAVKGKKLARFQEIGVEPSAKLGQHAPAKVHISAWLKVFRQIEIYLKKKHDGRMPQVADFSEKHRVWLKRQCDKIHQGALEPWQLEKLDEIGFDPNNLPEPLTKVERKHGQEADWQDRMDRLRRFIQEHGHGNVARSYSDKKLYAFVQRVRMRKRQNSLSPEQVSELTALGFSFDPSREVTPAWMRVYEVLKVYYQEHGDCHVPRSYPPNQALAEFVAQQKQRGRKGLLLAEHIRLLDALNFEWVSGPPQPKDQ
jgi:hypothetical protein